MKKLSSSIWESIFFFILMIAFDFTYFDNNDQPIEEYEGNMF